MCKFAETFNALENPPVDDEVLKKSVKNLLSELKFPIDIKNWSPDKLSAYIQQTEAKADYLSDWIIKNRRILNEFNYKKYRAALDVLQERYMKKIRALRKMLPKPLSRASINNWFDQAKKS